MVPMYMWSGLPKKKVYAERLVWAIIFLGSFVGVAHLGEPFVRGDRERGEGSLIWSFHHRSFVCAKEWLVTRQYEVIQESISSSTTSPCQYLQFIQFGIFKCMLAVKYDNSRSLVTHWFQL